MRSNYRRLGDYIQEVTLRNTELNVSNLLGININKFFMPSVANVVGTDMSKYKIVKKRQFACNRMHVGRDKRLPVALWEEAEDIIVSPAYNVFEVIDEEVLSPEYLMMWFSRKELDRNAWFYTDADVRGGLNWNDFCNLELPVPSIEKQMEIVKEYKVLQDRISLNNTLIEKLEDTAQTIYKQWFVDFDFHDENGNPYKSSGGEMYYNKELGTEIPIGWDMQNLGQIMSIKHGFAFKGENIVSYENKYVLLTPGNFRIGGGFKPDNFKYYNGEVNESFIFESGDLMVTMTDLSVGADTIGFPAFIPNIKNKIFLHNQRLGKIFIKYELKNFIYWLMRSSNYRNTILGGITGTTVKHTSPSKILEYEFAFYYDELLFKKFEEVSEKIQIRIEQIVIENNNILVLKDLLLSKLATVEG